MPKRKRKVNRRHTMGGPIRDDHVYRLACPCCGDVTVIRGSNLRRLAEGAQVAGVRVQFDVSLLPGVDWAADVPDEVIAVAVQRCGVAGDQ